MPREEKGPVELGENIAWTRGDLKKGRVLVQKSATSNDVEWAWWPIIGGLILAIGGVLLYMLGEAGWLARVSELLRQ